MKRLGYLALALFVAGACNDAITGLGPPSDPATETFAPALNVDISQMTKTPEGVYYRDVTVGTGDSVTKKTTRDSVNYAGYLKDGKLFDSGSGVAFDPLGLIAGFRIGMLGMRVGGSRKIVIPSELGYGGRSVKNPDGTIKIPRQSTLIFDVLLLAVTNPDSTSK